MLILMYHGLGRRAPEADPDNLFVPAERLEPQLRWLLGHGWRPVDPRRLGTTSNRRKEFLVTFDDGYQSMLAEAAPILARLGIPSVCFVLPGLFGRDSNWDAGVREPLLSADEVRRLPDFGMQVGSHSWCHRDLPTLDPAALRADVFGAAAALEDLLGSRPRLFAYPYGRHDRATRELVATSGATHAFATYTRTATQFSLPRVDINATDTLRTFALKTLPGYSRLREVSGKAPAVRRALHAVVGRAGH